MPTALPCSLDSQPAHGPAGRPGVPAGQQHPAENDGDGVVLGQAGDLSQGIESRDGVAAAEQAMRAPRGQPYGSCCWRPMLWPSRRAWISASKRVLRLGVRLGSIHDGATTYGTP